MEERALSWDERIAWLRLIRTPTIGPVAFRDLLRLYKNAEAALDAVPSLARKKSVQIPSKDIIEAELNRFEDMGGKIVASCEADYPTYLKALDPPPPVISLLGKRPDILNTPSVAIVGSRNASAIGQRFAAQIATELGEAGYTIISGLARGIDAAAHRGSLNSGTAAVLGGGPDHIYPRDNTDLYNDILQNGVLVSESPLGYRATARDFPRRNRIISGLSLGVVVIEAAERSGTLITARYALEQNREVMAAPGSPLDPRTKGCNRLIRQGAALIESSQDVIDILSDVRPPEPQYKFNLEETRENWSSPQPDMKKARETISTLVSPTPTIRDDIIRMSGLPTSLAIAVLLEMELCGETITEVDGRIAKAY